MKIQGTPEFRTLSNEEIAAVLRRNHVGRIAYSSNDRVDIQPIHYVFTGGWLYGRTSRGTKLSMILRNRWVAFEVDEIEDTFCWRSVVVHGRFELVSLDDDEEERAVWLRALDLLRRVVPDTFEETDPTPFRNVLFRISVEEATGRTAQPRVTEEDPAIIAAAAPLPPVAWG